MTSNNRPHEVHHRQDVTDHSQANAFNFMQATGEENLDGVR